MLFALHFVLILVAKPVWWSIKFKLRVILFAILQGNRRKTLVKRRLEGISGLSNNAKSVLGIDEKLIHLRLQMSFQ